MSAQLRRYIHRAAENNEFVITVSEGEGQWRKVTLRPRPADQPVQKKAEPASAPAAKAAAVVLTETTVNQNAAGTEITETVAEVVHPVSAEAPALQNAEQSANTSAEAPAADVNAAQQQAPQEPAAQAADDAAGATCQAEMARNCAEGETQTGCACGPLFENPQENTQEAQPAPAAPEQK